MDFDTKQSVLLAIYTEYQKDIPNFIENITPTGLKMGDDVFAFAIKKLLNEGLICGAEISKVLGPFTPQIDMYNTMITPTGIQYVEGKMGISANLSGKEKVEIVKKSLSEKGYDLLTDLLAKIIAEMAKQ